MRKNKTKQNQQQTQNQTKNSLNMKDLAESNY